MRTRAHVSLLLIEIAIFQFGNRKKYDHHHDDDRIITAIIFFGRFKPFIFYYERVFLVVL